MVVAVLEQCRICDSMSTSLVYTGFFISSLLLFVFIAAVFHRLLKRARIGETRTRDLTVILISPFLCTLLAVLAMWHSPSKGSYGHLCLCALSSIVSACLCSYALRVFAKGSFRFFASLALITTMIAGLPGTLVSVAWLTWLLMQWAHSIH